MIHNYADTLLSAEMSAVYDRWALQEYSPPKWAARLHNCPKHRLKVHVMILTDKLICVEAIMNHVYNHF